MITVGPFDLHSVVNGHLRLDGGAMFGVVPKVMWAPKADVDDLNRILLAMRTLIAIERRPAGRIVLVDTGAGPKWSPEEAERYAIEPHPPAIEDALRAIGRTPADVTDVVVTHLHFDHNGGLSEWVGESGGPTRLRFPAARHWIHRRQWDHAHHPHLKDRASYLARDWAALEAADVLQFVDGDNPDPPFEGCAWFLSHGHTPYQLLPVFGAPGAPRLLFTGDVIPTAAHLATPWVMAYDVEPLRTIAEKEQVYRLCREEGLLLAFPHDPATPGVELNPAAPRPTIARQLPL